jgi:hypothetical protein
MKEQKWDRSEHHLDGVSYAMELHLVMRYIHKQGLAKRRLKVEEVFQPFDTGTQRGVRADMPTDVKLTRGTRLRRAFGKLDLW